jgi:hypothetical protein
MNDHDSQTDRVSALEKTKSTSEFKGSQDIDSPFHGCGGQFEK